MIHKTIIIVGGGPVGLSMALELAGQGKQVTIIDQALDNRHDSRVLALSYASYEILHNLAVLPASLVTPIDGVDISHHGFGVSQIKASLLNLQHLGYTIRYADLCAKMKEQALTHPLIEIIAGEVIEVHDGASYTTLIYQQNEENHLVTADLLIMAEGGKLLSESNLKKISHDYKQQAIVAHIKTRTNVKNLAYERFARRGPLVLLPYDDHFVVVWSVAEELAVKFKQDPAIFICELDCEFTSRLGGAKLISEITSFPLQLIQVKQRLLQRIVMIGNSAQIVHPISAQGLNLGLRDVTILSDLLAKDNTLQLNNLAGFDRLRSKDVNAVVWFTHFLATNIEKQGKIFDSLRAFGLITLSNLPLVQNWIARSLIFGI